MTVTLGQPLSPHPDELAALLASVSTSGRWTNDGPLVALLEQRLAATQGWRSVAATSSGTTALTAALLALDLAAGSEVITTPLTFRATALAIEAAGLTPVFAAVDPLTLNLLPDAVEQAVSPRTGAILPVHLFGVPVDPAIDEVASRLDIPVVYDAAHAFGLGSISGRGAATAYSLHATKLLHTGEGGAVATNDPAMARRVRAVRNFGFGGGEDAGPGLNAKLSEVAAAVGLAVWGAVDAEMDARRQVREAYSAGLVPGGRAQAHVPGIERALVMEPVRCSPDDQAALVADLAAAGIAARTFPALCGPTQRFRTARIVGASREDTVALASTVIALPIHGGVLPHHTDAAAEVLRG